MVLFIKYIKQSCSTSLFCNCYSYFWVTQYSSNVISQDSPLVQEGLEKVVVYLQDASPLTLLLPGWFLVKISLQASGFKIMKFTYFAPWLGEVMKEEKINEFKSKIGLQN